MITDDEWVKLKVGDVVYYVCIDDVIKEEIAFIGDTYFSLVTWFVNQKKNNIDYYTNEADALRKALTLAGESVQKAISRTQEIKKRIKQLEQEDGN